MQMCGDKFVGMLSGGGGKRYLVVIQKNYRRGGLYKYAQ